MIVFGSVLCDTIQVFGNPITEEVFGLEINPRFGGGYPLAAEAGARYGEWLIREYIHDEDIRFFESWKIKCRRLWCLQHHLNMLRTCSEIKDLPVIYNQFNIFLLPFRLYVCSVKLG